MLTLDPVASLAHLSPVVSGQWQFHYTMVSVLDFLDTGNRECNTSH